MEQDRKIIVVTGSTGRIGEAVMCRFGPRPEDAVGFDRKVPDPPPQWRGTRRVLRGLRRAQLEVEQLIFSSTMLVHKPAELGQFINENWPLEPSWAYPESKVRTEAPPKMVEAMKADPGQWYEDNGLMPPDGES